jgi:hypothetical protein
MISNNFMKLYTSFMCNINTCVFYTLIQSVLIISVNEVWNTCEIDQLSKSHSNSIDMKLQQSYM